MDDVQVDVQEVLEEVKVINPLVLELAIERVARRKQGEELQRAEAMLEAYAKKDGESSHG